MPKTFNSFSPTLLLLFIVVLNVSCGFAYEKHLTKNYYIIGVDSNEDLSLSYKLSSGDFIGKAPGEILEYGFNDTVLIAKTRFDSKSAPVIYIIDMRKDYDLALEENFRVGPVSQIDYDRDWKPRFNLVFKKVEK